MRQLIGPQSGLEGAPNKVGLVRKLASEGNGRASKAAGGSQKQP